MPPSSGRLLSCASLSSAPSSEGKREHPGKTDALGLLDSQDPRTETLGKGGGGGQAQSLQLHLPSPDPTSFSLSFLFPGSSSRCLSLPPLLPSLTGTQGAYAVLDPDSAVTGR